MFQRLVGPRIEEALSDTPVVLVVGPRRAGKTTAVRRLGGEARTYLTLDDQTTLDAASEDPVGFVRALDRCTIDEVQRVPELLLAIKRSVDQDYRPGRFLLTGSANVLTLPRVADSLAGRMETIQMLPLARVETQGTAPTFVERLFAGEFASLPNADFGEELVRIVLTGGFPEAVARTSERRRQDWARSYLEAVLGRDLREIAETELLTDLSRFVRLLAHHDAQLTNFSEIGRDLGVNYKTSQRYVGLLERIYLVTLLQPWHTNAIKRIIKTPKLHFVDSGILAAARGLTIERAIADRATFGAVLETFVVGEVAKLLGGTNVRASRYHFRDHAGREVDLVLERDDGTIAGIEIKASATVGAGDFAGLRTLAEASGDRFASGVVLYDSDTVVPFGDRLAAVPLSSLWN